LSENIAPVNVQVLTLVVLKKMEDEMQLIDSYVDKRLKKSFQPNDLISIKSFIRSDEQLKTNLTSMITALNADDCENSKKNIEESIVMLFKEIYERIEKKNNSWTWSILTFFIKFIFAFLGTVLGSTIHSELFIIIGGCAGLVFGNHLADILKTNRNKLIDMKKMQ
jgi:hypothetical protein